MNNLSYYCQLFRKMASEISPSSLEGSPSMLPMSVGLPLCELAGPQFSSSPKGLLYVSSESRPSPLPSPGPRVCQRVVYPCSLGFRFLPPSFDSLFYLLQRATPSRVKEGRSIRTYRLGGVCHYSKSQSSHPFLPPLLLPFFSFTLYKVRLYWSHLYLSFLYLLGPFIPPSWFFSRDSGYCDSPPLPPEHVFTLHLLHFFFFLCPRQCETFPRSSLCVSAYL